MTDHSPVSVRQAGTGWTARCACGDYIGVVLGVTENAIRAQIRRTRAGA